MPPLRLVMVTRRFWPLVGGAERVMANLAHEFQQLGHPVSLLTAAWEPSWPREFSHGSIPVTRLPQPRTRGWGTIRYMHSLGRWLRQHADQFDLVFVSMLKHDAYVAVTCGQESGKPVVIRAEGSGLTGDCHWQETGRFGQRIRRRTQLASAIIAPSDEIQRELEQAGYRPETTFPIPNGVAVPPPRERHRQPAARRALADVHAALDVAAHAPLAVYTGRLHPDKGLLDLVRAWPAVLQRWADAKLWLVGEGEAANQLWDEIRQLDLVHSVILPGSFDEVDDVLLAADVFVLPSYQEGLSLSLLEAMAAELPVIATDIPGNRQVVRNGVTGWLVPPRDPRTLAACLIERLEQRHQMTPEAQRARHLVEEHYSVRRMALAHLDVFEACLERTQGRKP